MEQEHVDGGYTAPKILPEVIDAFESCGWYVTDCKDGTYEISADEGDLTSCEFTLMVDMRDKDADSPKVWATEVRRSAESFDIDEEVELWAQADRDSRPAIADYMEDLLAFQKGPLRFLEKFLPDTLSSIQMDEGTVRDWYMAAYPTDDMGAELNGSLTFSELVAGDTFDQDIYEVLGVGDSLVRERVFQETASRTGASYQDVYEYFIEGHPLPYPICRDLGSRGPDGDLDEIAADADVAAAMNTPTSRGDFDALDADAIESAQLLQSKATTGFPWGFGAI